MRNVIIAGIGMGNRNTLTIGAFDAIKNCDCLIGAQRLLDSFDDLGCRKESLITSQDIADFIDNNSQYNSTGVLFSGDIGFYSGAKKLYPLLQDYNVQTFCGITSVQYLCAKLHMPWEDVHLVSAHGKDCRYISHVINHKKTLFLMDNKNTPNDLCRQLCAHGLKGTQIYIGCNLSNNDEKIYKGTVEEFSDVSFAPLSVVLVENPYMFNRDIATHGIADSEYIRGETPMTKCEVRSVSLSKLNLRENHIVYDIGAGTGSVSIEAALKSRYGWVYSIEKDAYSCKLIKSNQEKFKVVNMSIIEGTAPQALKELPPPDAVFIGGSSGNMSEILRCVTAKNPKVRIVVNAITLESVSEAVSALEKQGFETETVQLSVAKAKKLGNCHMMMANNPITIISGQRNEAL